MKKSLLPFVAFLGALSFSACDDADVNKANYALVEANSLVEWKGYGPNQSHEGSFAVKSQQIEVIDGKLKSGTFSIPIASIQNYDLPGELKPVLLHHLKSEDFFNIALHPDATFKITRVQPLEVSAGGNAEGANHTVTGDFSLLGQTHAITIPARIDFKSGDLTIQATFQLDRTKWGMTYAADPQLGEHHIMPAVEIKLDLLANKE